MDCLQVPRFSAGNGAACLKRTERVEDYLDHILEAIGRATSYVLPLADLEAFRKNPLVKDAVVRNLEIIGEAISKIHKASPDFIQSDGLVVGQIEGEEAAKGNVLPFNDLMIVAAAIEQGYAVLTSKLRHLQKIPGLTVIPF